MIEFFMYGFKYESEDSNLYQNYNPQKGTIMSSWDEVAEVFLDFFGDNEEVIKEGINWFRTNELDIPNSLMNHILDDLKQEKIQYIKDSKQKAQDIGVLYKDKHYQMDADGKANILGIRIAIQDGSLTNFPVLFKTYENTYEELTKAQFMEMSNAALNFVYECLMQKENLMNMVEEAKSAEDLEKIVWEFN